MQFTRPTRRVAVVTAATVAAVSLAGGALAMTSAGSTPNAGTPASTGHGAMPGMSEPAASPAKGAHEGMPAAGMPATGTLADVPSGTSLSRDGYLLRMSSPTTVRPTDTTPFTFSVVSGTKTVTAFAGENGKKMHLVVVRRDLTGFQHLHPTMAADGTWSTPLKLGAPGSYRAYADFLPAERAAAGQGPLALATDLAAPGSWDPQPLPGAASRSTSGSVTAELSGTATAGQASELTFTLSSAGGPVTDLQPYLGSFGHLVALREGDLAYLHVHPVAASAGSPTLTFGADFPTPGRYRLFLQVQRAGAVTALPFTLEVPAAMTG